jgi:hypothetical protein|tara:strand:- start:28 stop:465 length:438 start_codon:yes stop_codon:yes gene_type:complete
MKICIFDYDETLIIGETPTGETLSAFYRRNTFLNNLFYKKTNLVKLAREEKAKGNLIVICTAREKRFWLKAVLFLKGIPCDVLIERAIGDITPTGLLKQKQILQLIISNNDYIFADKDFYDDSQENLREVSKINNVKVFDAKRLA